jgi:tetratricopeptide (TPR) repeat protein
MGGSKALGVCIKRHREPRSQKVLADAVGRSPRWMAYAEAGKTDLGWNDLIAIANFIDHTKRQAFLDDATFLLYEEVGMESLKKDVLAAVQRRDFLSVLGVGAAGVDMERLSRALQGIGIDAGVAHAMATLNRSYVDQSRALAPVFVLSGLQGHLRDYFELAMAAPEAVSRDLKAGAAEAALLSGMLSFRAGYPTEAFHYWMLAAGLAAESGHTTAQAYAVVVKQEMPASPAAGGGVGDASTALRALNQGLAILGPRSAGVAAVTFLAWRSWTHAALGDASAARRDMGEAERLLSKVDQPASEDFLGIGVLSPQLLAAEQATTALFLRQPSEVIQILEPGIGSNLLPGWRPARMADLAAAYAQKGHFDHAVDTLLKAADLAQEANDAWRWRRIRGTRQTQLPANLAGDAIQELDRKLATRGSAA